MTDSITQLSNYFQAHKASHTISWAEYSKGPSHQIKWTMICKVSGEIKGTGVADSKAAAKQEAARQAGASFFNGDNSGNGAASPKRHKKSVLGRGEGEEGYVASAAMTDVAEVDHQPQRKAQDSLPILVEAVVACSPKEKWNPIVTTILAQDQLRGAAPLMLPDYFSTQNIVTSSVQSHLLRNIALFTVSASLEEAKSNHHYECVQKQVREEWLKVGGLLMGLAAVETAALALNAGSVFTVNTIAQITISGSSISTGIGLLCNIYVLLRFSLAEVQVFKHRVRDNYEIRAGSSINRTESYVFFALVARLPLLLAMISILFIVVFLADAAYKVSPSVVLSILVSTAIIFYLQYLCWGLIWMGFGLLKLLGWLVVGLSNCAAWPLWAFTYVVEKAQEL